MEKSVPFKTILVIGDNHEEIIKKYSLDTKVEPYVYAKLDDSKKMKTEALAKLENILDSDNISDIERILYQTKYDDIREMDDFEYYMYITKGCHYDEENGNALSETNPNAHYQYEKCYEKSLEKYGDDGEGPFSNPFKLIHGGKSYSARKSVIDWNLMHMNNISTYESAWEIVVEGREPETENEKTIYAHMSNKKDYFLKFHSKEEYVTFNCAFWCYGVATEEKYEELGQTGTDIDWVTNFYNRFIAELPDDTLLTIYEAKSIK